MELMYDEDKVERLLNAASSSSEFSIETNTTCAAPSMQSNDLPPCAKTRKYENTIVQPSFQTCLLTDNVRN